MKRWPILFSFLLFLALCMSGTYWVMQFIKPEVRSVAMPKPQAKAEVDPEVAMGLFGGHLSVAAASNFQLKGVVVSQNAAESVAILAADGKPAEAVRLNAEIVPGVTIKEVHSQYVLLSENGVVKRVELPAAATIGHGDSPIGIQPQPGPIPAPNIVQQAPPPQNAVPPEGEQNPPPPPPPEMGNRIGRSGGRVRNNLNN
ncbi:MAG TPA: type II secretion system protein N [Burkholderiaceae bacterium]|jgi:general secretion pathway protein C